MVILDMRLQVSQHTHQARVVLRNACRHSAFAIMGDLGEGSLEGQGHPGDGVDRDRRSSGTGGRGGCWQTAEWGTADSVKEKHSLALSMHRSDCIRREKITMLY